MPQCILKAFVGVWSREKKPDLSGRSDIRLFNWRAIQGQAGQTNIVKIPRHLYHVREIFPLAAKVFQWNSETVFQRCSVKWCLRPATLLKKRLWHRCFPVNFVRFLRTPFSIEHLWWLLLRISFERAFTQKIQLHKQ